MTEPTQQQKTNEANGAEDLDPIIGAYRKSILENPGRFIEGLRSALLCIDLQYLDAARDQGIFRDLPASEKEYYFKQLEHTVIPNVQKLQRACRDSGVEIIHIRIQALTQDGRDRSLAHKRLDLLATPGSKFARFLDPVAPRWDEIVLNKTASGVFDSTNLHYILRNLDIQQLIVTGVYTDECVSTAVRVGADLGFYVILVSDACTTVTPKLQESSLATLRNRYARIIDTSQVIDEISKGEGRNPNLKDHSNHSDNRRSPQASSRRGTRRTVVLLGGSAFSHPGKNATNGGQFDFAVSATEKLAPLFEGRRELVISHGHSPQAGQLLTRVEDSIAETNAIPLEVCVADTEGELGYVLQQCLHNVFRKLGIERPVVSLITQVVVDEGDPAFAQPAKPVGPVLSPKRAKMLAEKGIAMQKFASGWRRVVPSPKPLEIIEVDTIQELLRTGTVVIGAGGGGVAVSRDDNGILKGSESVVDKDEAGALLARQLNADELLILTSVPCIYRFFGTDRIEPIGHITPEALRRVGEENPFETTTMRPKVKAAIDFAMSGGRAIICDVESLDKALRGEAGTIVADAS